MAWKTFLGSIMKLINAGIIGLGVGESHISGYQAHKQCRVTAICDFNREALERVSQRHPHLKTYASAEELINDPDIDVVSIASYDNYHYEQIAAALEINKHVFVEKPLCLLEEEAIKIRSLLREKPHLKLSSNLILRHSPRFTKLKKKIDAGAMGELYYLEADYNYGRMDKITKGWRGKLDYYSIVLGGGVHMVDLLLWLSGDTVEEVSAFGNGISSAGTNFQYNDLVASVLRFKSGIVGKMTCNFGCVMPHFHGLSVFGTEATFINGPGNAHYFRSRDAAAKPMPDKSRYPGVQKGGLLANFIDSVIDEVPQVVSSEDIFMGISVCFAIEKAMRENRVVRVDYI